MLMKSWGVWVMVLGHGSCSGLFQGCVVKRDNLQEHTVLFYWNSLGWKWPFHPSSPSPLQSTPPTTAGSQQHHHCLLVGFSLSDPTWKEEKKKKPKYCDKSISHVLFDGNVHIPKKTSSWDPAFNQKDKHWQYFFFIWLGERWYKFP